MDSKLFFTKFYVFRTATIVCDDEETHFAVLTKDIYNRIVALNQDKIHNENIEFLKTLLPFKGWPKGNLDQIFYQLEERVYKKGQVIYKEGDEADRIFFIREGEVEVVLCDGLFFYFW
jgi:CRP-like cAMP-binding protein